MGGANTGRDVHVLIIGAGITGLVIGHGLKKAGVPFTIFEAEPCHTTRSREWSVGVHWALPMLNNLLPDNLAQSLSEAQNDPFSTLPDQKTLQIWGGDDKEAKVLKDLEIPKTVRFSRQKLRALCARELDIKYDHHLETINYDDDGIGVTGIFEGGQTYTGTFLVGADGPNSSVRNLLFPKGEAETTSMGNINASSTVSYHDDEKAKIVLKACPVFSIAVSTSNVFHFLSIHNIPSPTSPPSEWSFQVSSSWLPDSAASSEMTNAERLAEMKAKCEHSPEPFRSAVMWLPEDQVVTHDDFSYWISRMWDTHRGRVTLAGDAAHPMTPHRGQGLNNAVCDAANFVKAMTAVRDGDAKDRTEVVNDYSREVVERGAEEVIVSKKIGETFLAYDSLMEKPVMKIGLERQDANRRTVEV